MRLYLLLSLVFIIVSCEGNLPQKSISKSSVSLNANSVEKENKNLELLGITFDGEQGLEELSTVKK